MSTGEEAGEARAGEVGGAGAGGCPLSGLSSRPSLVIDTLKEVDEARRCYRMVGGVLVERTVKEVLPALENNKEQVSSNPFLEALGSGGAGEGRPGAATVVESSLCPA